MKKMIGPVFIGMAAMLWATDALVRFPTVNRMDPLFIVMAEHVIGVLFLLPFLLGAKRRELFKLRFMDWISAAVIGIGGSAAATVLFTASFRYVNPSVAILLQKLQPVMVVFLAYAILGERPQKGFWGWAALALFSGFVLNFPSFGTGQLEFRSKGSVYALAAAGLWAVATVFGKLFVSRIAPSVVTFWRFAFGLAALITFFVLSGRSMP